MNRYLIVLIGLLMIVVAAVTALLIRYSPEHPVLLKYATFTARNLGPPLLAEVYTDGKLNDSIKVFSNDRSSVLLYLSDEPQIGRVIIVNWEHNLVGIPLGANKNDYDFFWGRLFQSEAGSITVPFNSVKLSHPFNPALTQSENKITFVIAPPTDEDFLFRFRTVRIVLKSNS